MRMFLSPGRVTLLVLCVLGGRFAHAADTGTVVTERVTNDTGTFVKERVTKSAKERSATATATDKTHAHPKTNLDRTPDVIYVPTPQPVVDRMLELAEVKKGDVVYDLGCGDGRIIVTAAKKYGARAKGFDINPERVRETEVNIRENKVESLASVEHADIFDLDLSEANVVTLYLLPSLNVKLIPQLEKLKPGARIVSHDFDMRGIKPAKVVRVEVPTVGSRTIYLFKTPLEHESQ